MSSFTLATGGYDNTIRFFDATNQTMIRTIQFCDQQVLRLAFSGDCPISSDAPLYLVAGGSPSVAVYDVTTPHTSPNVFQVYQGHSEAITAVGFEPRNTAFVFSASEDGTLQTWLPALAPITVNPQQHYAALTGPHAALHPMAAGSTLEDGTPRFPAVPAKMRNEDGKNGMAVPIHDAVYYPPSDLFFTADQGGRLRVWDHATSKCRHTLIPHPSKRNIQCLDISSDYELLAAANFDGIVFLYYTKEILSDPQKTKPMSFPANSTYIPRVRLSATVTLLVCTTSSGAIKVFRIADVVNREEKAREARAMEPSGESPDDSVTPIRDFTGHPGWVWDAAFVEDRDDYLFTCSSNMQVMLWALNDIQGSNEYAGHQKGVVCLAVRERMSAGITPDHFGPPQPNEQPIHPPSNTSPMLMVPSDNDAAPGEYTGNTSSHGQQTGEPAEA